MNNTIKGFRGKDGPIRLDYSGVANVPGAIQSIAELTAQPGDHFEVETVDSTGRVATVKAVAKPGGNSGQNPTQGGLTAEQINALDGLLKVIAYDEDAEYAAAYAAFQTAFGIGSGGDSGGGDDSGGDSGGDDSGGNNTGVSDETTWTDGVPYTFNMVEGEFVRKTGEIKTDAAWNRTPYLYCKGAAKIGVHNPFATSTGYNCFYTEDKMFLSSFNVTATSTAGSQKDTTVPDGAAYFILSYDASGGNNTGQPYSVTPYANA